MTRFFRHRSAVVGLSIILIAIFIALFAPMLTKYNPIEQYRDSQVNPLTPSFEHPMGGDNLDRDVYTRVLYGARVSLLVGLVAELISLLVGVSIGLLAGYLGRFWDNLLMRITDTFFAFPGVLLAIALMALFQAQQFEFLSQIKVCGINGLFSLFIALGLTGWTGHARVVRGLVLSLKEREFIEAARAIGASNWHIITRHLLPNCLSAIIVLSSLGIAGHILGEAGLSYIGIGVPPPYPSWGKMLNEGRNYFNVAPWLALGPGLALSLTVLGFNLLGDGLRDLLDPRLK